MTVSVPVAQVVSDRVGGFWGWVPPEIWVVVVWALWPAAAQAVGPVEVG